MTSDLSIEWFVDDIRAALDFDEVQALFSTVRGPEGPNNRLWDNIHEYYLDVCQRTRQELPDDHEYAHFDALDVMSGMGFCKLYGITLPEDIRRRLVSPLPVALVVHALAEMRRQIKSLTEDARTLSDLEDTERHMTDMHELQSHAFWILHGLECLWAAFIVIDDEYHIEPDKWAPVPFTDKSAADFFQFNPVNPMRDIIDAFNEGDKVLQSPECLRALSIVGPTVLNDMRDRLVQEFRYLPWWLDGRLERVYIENRGGKK